jgi:hypothetical protein
MVSGINAFANNTNGTHNQYRFTLTNLRKHSAATDLHVSVTYRVKHLTEDWPPWTVIDVPIGSNNSIAFLKSNLHTLMYFDQIGPGHYSKFPEAIREQIKHGDVRLEDVLKLGEPGTAKIQVVIRASHSYTNATRTWRFRLSDVTFERPNTLIGPKPIVDVYPPPFRRWATARLKWQFHRMRTSLRRHSQTTPVATVTDSDSVESTVAKKGSLRRKVPFRRR